MPRRSPATAPDGAQQSCCGKSGGLPCSPLPYRPILAAARRHPGLVDLLAALRAVDTARPAEIHCPPRDAADLIGSDEAYSGRPPCPDCANRVERIRARPRLPVRKRPGGPEAGVRVPPVLRTTTAARGRVSADPRAARVKTGSGDTVLTQSPAASIPTTRVRRNLVSSGQEEPTAASWQAARPPRWLTIASVLLLVAMAASLVYLATTASGLNSVAFYAAAAMFALLAGWRWLTETRPGFRTSRVGGRILTAMSIAAILLVGLTAWNLASM